MNSVSDRLSSVIVKHKALSFLIIATLAAFLSSLLFYSPISPIYPEYSFDSSSVDTYFFMRSGEAMLEGNLPYLDFYDHKGILVFLYYELGMFLGGRMGVFLLSCVTLLGTFFFLLMAAYEWKGRLKEVYFTLFSMMTVLALSGNSSQVGMLVTPFVTLAMYLFALGMKRNSRFFTLAALVCGIEVGVAFNTRATDGFLCLGMCLYLFIYAIMKRKAKDLIFQALCCIFGFALILTLCWGYCYVQGYFWQMIEINYLVNGKYAVSSIAGQTPLMIAVLVLCLFLNTAHGIQLMRKKEIDLAVFLLSVGSFVLLLNIPIAKYHHYFISFAPYLGFVAGDILSSIRFHKAIQSKSLKMASPALPALLFLISFCTYYLGDSDFSNKRSEAVYNEIVETIPDLEEMEDDDVFFVDCSAALMMRADIDSECAYQSYQGWYSQVNEEADLGTLDYLKEYQPDYVVRGTMGDLDYSSLHYMKFIVNHYIDITPSDGEEGIFIYRRIGSLREKTDTEQPDMSTGSGIVSPDLNRGDNHTKEN